MAFHFSLDPLLRLRRSQLRQERVRLETISSELAQARSRLDALVAGSLAWEKEARRSLAAGEPGAQLQWDARFKERVSSLVDEQKSRVAEIQRRRGEQLAEYLRARQRCEAVEALLQRSQEIYRREQSRREQERLDEIFLTRLFLLPDE